MPATNPFLRAHEPNPAGPAIPAGNLAGQVIENLSRGASLRRLEQTRLNYLVYEPAHAHVVRHAQRQEGKQNRRSTVTH
jgi:hypothetical protein